MANWLDTAPDEDTPYQGVGGVLEQLRNRDKDAASLAESPTNPFTGQFRWVRADNKFQEWNGSAWVDKVISIAGGGSGASTAAGARTNLGLGTMAVQNDNAVAITGGFATGLASLGVVGNTNLSGTLAVASAAVNSIQTSGGIRAGSGPVDIINTAGKIPAISSSYFSDVSGANITGVGHLPIAETVTGLWTFSAGIKVTDDYLSNLHRFRDLADTETWVQFNSIVAATDNRVTIVNAKNRIGLFLGDGLDTSGYGVNEFSSAIRFNGQNTSWGDIAYYPTAGDEAQFRFYRDNSTVGDGTLANVRVRNITTDDGTLSNPSKNYASTPALGFYKISSSVEGHAGGIIASGAVTASQLTSTGSIVGNSLTISGASGLGSVTASSLVSTTIQSDSSNSLLYQYFSAPAPASGTALILDAFGGIRPSVSSIRYKENIRYLLKDGFKLDKFLQLRPVLFDYKESPSKNILGFIAEDLEKLGLEEFLNYNHYGELESIRNESFTVYLFYLVLELYRNLMKDYVHVS